MSLSPLSIAAGPGPGKAVDREVQQLPTPYGHRSHAHAGNVDIDLSRSRVVFVLARSPATKPSKPVYSGYLTPPSSPGTPMSTADSLPASDEASLPTYYRYLTIDSPRSSPPPPCTSPTTPTAPQRSQGSISAPIHASTMDFSMPVGHEKYQLSIAALEAKMVATPVPPTRP